MATKIPYSNLGDFTGLRDELFLRFGSQLADPNTDVRLKARDSALEFMQENGFYVDSQFKYVTLPDNPEEHLMLALKWS